MAATIRTNSENSVSLEDKIMIIDTDTVIDIACERQKRWSAVLYGNNWLNIIYMATCLDFPSRYIIVLGYTSEMLDENPDCHWSTTILWYSNTGDIVKL